MNIPNVIRETTSQIIQKRPDVIVLACSQRSKFEHWLKFELAAAMARNYGFSSILIEPPYPSGGKADLSLQVQDQVWYIELKTSNTNWRVAGVENKNRPITMNINEIIEDIHKIREKSLPAKGLVAFVLFPIPDRIWRSEMCKLLQHLHRIESECNLPIDILADHASFVHVTPDYGVLVFIVEAN